MTRVTDSSIRMCRETSRQTFRSSCGDESIGLCFLGNIMTRLGNITVYPCYITVLIPTHTPVRKKTN